MEASNIYQPFRKYCKENSIQRQVKIRHTTQQNGVTERKNRTIVEMVSSMLRGKGLSNNLWAEAVNIFVYILNQSPTKVVCNETPYEAWHKKKPNVSNLKIYGCVTYSLITSGNKDKCKKK